MMGNQLRELILLRHAKSDWKAGNQADIDRPLSGRGKKNAQKVGKWMHQNTLIPDLILTSPAKRALQTLKRICNECGTQTITIDELYNADLDTLKRILAEAPPVERIMIIGHNPGIERLFNFLQKNTKEQETHLFPTASLAHFVLPSEWHQLNSGDGRLMHFVRPKEIVLNAP